MFGKIQMNMSSIKILRNERQEIYNCLKNIVDDISKDEVIKNSIDFLYDDLKNIKNDYEFVETFIDEWIKMENRYIDYTLNVLMNENEEVEYISVAIIERL